MKAFEDFYLPLTDLSSYSLVHENLIFAIYIHTVLHPLKACFKNAICIRNIFKEKKSIANIHKNNKFPANLNSSTNLFPINLEKFSLHTYKLYERT